MKKEIIICFVIIIAVVILNIITINYTKESVQSLKVELSKIKEDIEQEKDVNSVNEKITGLKNNWEERYEKLAYYIEHDELEKVHLYIVGIDSNVNSDEYSHAIGELDKCDYILEHIEDKYSLSLKNIF